MRYKVSNNFYLDEFYVSKDHPELARAMVIKTEEVISLTRVATLICQPIRDFLGHGVTISSGKRDNMLNAAVGGEPTSQHRYGEAADMDIDGDEAWRAYIYAIKHLINDISQVIIYLNNTSIPTFIHGGVKSFRPECRKVGEALVKVGGLYIPFSDRRFDNIRTRYREI